MFDSLTYEELLALSNEMGPAYGRINKRHPHSDIAFDFFGIAEDVETALVSKAEAEGKFDFFSSLTDEELYALQGKAWDANTAIHNEDCRHRHQCTTFCREISAWAWDLEEICLTRAGLFKVVEHAY